MVRRLIYILTGKSYASSIGIIGGADGPTAIFVTTKPAEPIQWILTAAVAAAIIAAVVLVRRKNKK